LQGAGLAGAQLQGANLGQAHVQGADLSNVQLQATELFSAGLQGADLSGADLAESSFGETFVFRTKIQGANLATAAGSVNADRGSEPLTPPDIDRGIATATQFASRDLKNDSVVRFDRLKRDFQYDPEDEVKWSGMREASLVLDPDAAQHRRRLAKALGDLACEAAGAPYVARGLVTYGRLAALGNQLEGVRKRLKEGREKPDTCKGVVGFTQDD
jgi:hypothetical protein